jgi:predicted O-methyltransferase YrrM
MSNKDKLHAMRFDQYVTGLEDLIEYVNTFSNTQNMVMVEIGSYVGESTEIFANNFKTVISIDPFINDYDMNDSACHYMDFNKVYEIFKLNISKYDNIVHIKKISDDAVNDLKETKIDLVYIDGLHTYEQVKKDIQNYIGLINNSGFICGHDYHPDWQGVIDAIHETIGTPDMTFEDNSWVKKLPF